LIELLVPEGNRTDSVSAAALYHQLERRPRTVLLTIRAKQHCWTKRTASNSYAATRCVLFLTPPGSIAATLQRGERFRAGRHLGRAAAGNLHEFIAYTKANQATMQYGSAGVGSGSHLGCAQLNAAMGVNTVHVPYRGSPPATQDLIAGRIDYFCALAAAAMPLLASDSIRAIAIMTRERSPLLPNLASAQEQGLADLDSNFWSGFFVPPAAVIERLQAAGWKP
jgi:hypothetical protein